MQPDPQCTTPAPTVVGIGIGKDVVHLVGFGVLLSKRRAISTHSSSVSKADVRPSAG
ncbi:hypothetical protein [Mesorhizobium sp. WSM2239]|uniref:Uncharacterized protein n=2 Tax=unclassified Mesorhizobium TaxID=325217 RepID=A0AAU8DJ74_9HYPH